MGIIRRNRVERYVTLSQNNSQSRIEKEQQVKSKQVLLLLLLLSRRRTRGDVF